MKMILVIFIPFTLCVACKKSEEVPKMAEQDSLRAIAEQHSSALSSFFAQAVSDGMVFSSIKSKSSSLDDSKYISRDYVLSVLSEYPFLTLSMGSLTKTEPAFSEDLLKYYESAIDSLLGNRENLKSSVQLESAIAALINSPEFISAAGTNSEFIIVGLYVLLDSYKYWVEDGGFAEWITTLYSYEDQVRIASEMGFSIPLDGLADTKGSGAEMRAWSRMAQQDVENGGVLANCIGSDSWGFAGSSVGGLLFGGLGVAACLFGAAWSSIGTMMGI